jgi:hypothetical protein
VVTSSAKPGKLAMKVTGMFSVTFVPTVPLPCLDVAGNRWLSTEADSGHTTHIHRHQR